MLLDPPYFGRNWELVIFDSHVGIRVSGSTVEMKEGVLGLGALGIQTPEVRHDRSASICQENF